MTIMFRIRFRVFCIVTGFVFSLAAQETTAPDSLQTIDTTVSTVVQDTAAIPQESPNTNSEPLYRPASTIPPKPVDSAVISPASGEASGRIINSSDYIRGKMDGERDAKGNGIWFVAGLPGVCCYGIGLGGNLCSFLLPPSPPEGFLIGKSGEYILGYTEGYQSKGRLKNAKHATLGCLVGTGIEVAFYVIFFLLMESSY